VKRIELLAQIVELARHHGAIWRFERFERFERHGARHDIYSFGGKQIQIPRHREVGEMLARKILRDCRATLRMRDDKS